MSLSAALEKLGSTLIVRDLSSLVLGVPENFLEGPFPGFYYEPEEERYDYAGLQKTESTDDKCDVVVVFVVHRRDLPRAYTDMLKWVLAIVKRIKTKLETDTAARVYEDDGDKGFAVCLQSARYYYKSTDVISAARLTLRLSAYE